MSSEVITTIGKLLSPDDIYRDAIHIAIAPVVADGEIEPGEAIGFVKEDNTELVVSCESNPKIKVVGIADPFWGNTRLYVVDSVFGCF